MYELEAVAVGHDLARGQSKFTRTRSTATSEIDEPSGDGSSAVLADEVPAVPPVEAESVSDSGDQPLEERDEVPTSVDEELEEVVGTSASRRRPRTRVPV
jgi:single-strand DNA-binding protein